MVVEVREEWAKYLAMVRIYARVLQGLGLLTKHLQVLYRHVPTLDIQHADTLFLLEALDKEMKGVELWRHKRKQRAESSNGANGNGEPNAGSGTGGGGGVRIRGWRA